MKMNGSEVSGVMAVCGLLIGFSLSALKAQEMVPAADTYTARSLEAPVNTKPVEDKFWWSDDWYTGGKLAVPKNFEVREESETIENSTDGTEIPIIVFRPDDDAKYPGVLFQHGRRGLDPLAQNLARRLAARGFVVAAADVFAARFIDRWPTEHLPETEGDVNTAVDYLLSRRDISSNKICLYSHTRGGFYTLRVAVKFARQAKDVACYVSFYPHWQDPNASEALQVYRYHRDVDELNIPTLIFIGEFEQYQRRRSIETAVSFMKQSKRDVTLIVYPGVGRGFDFRPPTVRTFADDLATKDSNVRMAEFIRTHLEGDP